MTTFLFKSKKGVWDFGSEYNYKRFIAYLKENDNKLFRIEPEVSTRSLNQNRLYWKYLEIIERETGNNTNDLHEYFRRTLLSPKFIQVMGKEIKIPKSTTELKKHEFSDYMTKIEVETGVMIPDTDNYLASIDLAPLN